MVVAPFPERQSFFDDVVVVIFFQIKIPIVDQYASGVLKHREGKSAGGLGGDYFAGKAVVNQFGNSADVVYMGMGGKQYVDFPRIVRKRIPVDVVGDF